MTKRKDKIMWVRVTPKINNYLRDKAEYDDIEIAEVIRRSIMEYMLAHPIEEGK